MKRFFPLFVICILFFVLLPAQAVRAQHGDYPPLPPDAWKGQVSGKVVNQTSGKTVTEPIDVMLHAWDPENQERLMVHGKAGADGAYLFEDVDFHQSFSYSVMATYLGATYYSQPANVQKGDTTLILNAQVYDTTDDLSNVQIDRLHVLFYTEGGQLGVTQFYALSNTGKQTVKDAVSLPRDRSGTLKFYLPDEAENVSFGNDSGGRYVLLPGSFVDTAPIPPGENTSLVVVAYNLPYAGKLEYAYDAPVKIKGLSFLVLEGSGLSVEGEGLTPAGDTTLEDGSTFHVFNTPGLEAGESIRLKLSGEAEAEVMAGEAGTKKTGELELGIGAGVLGLALLGAGVWWWRRHEEEPEEILADSVEGFLDEIKTLDLAHERGELPDEEYQEKRSTLRDRLKELVSSHIDEVDASSLPMDVEP